MKKIYKRVIAWMLTFVLIVGNVEWVKAVEIQQEVVEGDAKQETVSENEEYDNVHISELSSEIKANKVISSSTIAKYFNDKVGTSVAQASCLAFIADGFAALGATRSSANCAYEYGSSHIVSTSMDNIPVGADVFFLWNSTHYKGTWYTCGNHYCHHIGVYVGDGYVVHTSGGKVVKTPLSDLLRKGTGYDCWNMDFRGWGYHGNVTIEEANIPQGFVDSISAGEGYVDVSGWVFDRDSVETPVEIHVYIGQDDNKEMVGSITANGYRPDVNSAYPGVGDYHGFGARIPTNKSGNQNVYLFALNVGAGSENPCIGSKTVNILADTTVPVISNVMITDVNGSGYTVSCTVTDNIEVDRVQFPTWTEKDGQDDLVEEWWTASTVTGTQNGNTYSFRVRDDAHNYERGLYTTHVYAYDTSGNYVSAGITYDFQNHGWMVAENTYNGHVYHIIDDKVTWDEAKQICENAGGHLVTITSAEEQQAIMNTIPSETTCKGYFIGGYTDNGNSRWVTGENFEYTYWSTDEPNNWNGVETVYEFYVNAGDLFGRWNDCVSNAEGRGFICEWDPDTETPVISDVQITDVDATGYTVSCTVTDNVGVDRVQFPTWTEYNSGDDLLADWGTNSAASGTANGNTYTFRVKDSDHNYERGIYYTHIYAYDAAGNYAMNDTVSVELKNEGKVVSEGSCDGSVYQLFDDRMTWEEAKEVCEDMGGHLVTITSAEEQAVVEGLMQDDAGSHGYFLGGYTEDSVSKWVTGETFEYSNWISGQPDSAVNGTDVEDVYIMCSNHYAAEYIGLWNDIYSNATGYGYICEFDADEVTSISLSETEISLGLGRTKELTATLSPEGGRFPMVNWSSEDESIVTVEGGALTAVGYGTTNIIAECGGVQATCTVTVVKPIESISLDLADKKMFKNETCQLVVSFLPEDATEEMKLVWTSTDPVVATVDEEGLITACSAGTTQISATLADDEEIKAVCEVTVESYVVSFESNGGTSVAPVECGKNEYITLPEEPTKNGYAFTGWYKDAECTELWDAENDAVTGNLTLYAGWMEYHEGLWIVDIPAQNYTGKAIKPEITVYHDSVKLVKGKDYTVQYKNNTKASAGQPATKQPTVVVTGKGNYSGKETATFEILQKDLSDTSISVDDVFVSFNGKAQKPKLVVKDGKKTLKAGRDYYIRNETTYVGVESYPLTLVGMGNYEGSREVVFTISSNIMISKASVSKIPNQMYTGEEIKPVLTVKHGGRVLAENVDYTVTYTNNVNTGTATAIISGINSYSGQRKVTFKIEGTPISKVSVYGITDLQYNGKVQEQNALRLYSLNGEELKEGTDYSVSYKNNLNAGTATMMITGMKGYSGTVKKTFKIVKYDILANSEGWLDMDESNLSVAYEKGGSKPDIKIRFKGKLLKNGQDYTLTYKKNQSVTGDYPSAEMVISGKGNFTGKVTGYFRIDTSNLEENVTLAVADKAFSNKKGGYRSEPVLTDKNGKKLTKGKDYLKDYRYFLVNADGTETVLLKDSVLNVGSVIRVYIEGCDNYEGILSATYVITPASFNKTKVKIATQEYTGKAITLDKSDITIKYNGTVLQDDEYEIVSYSNNVKAGTAKVVLKGKGNYGGTKTVQFKISKKFFLWWWK